MMNWIRKPGRFVVAIEDVQWAEPRTVYVVNSAVTAIDERGDYRDIYLKGTRVIESKLSMEDLLTLFGFTPSRSH